MTEPSDKAVLIRADAGADLGSGHVMRMLALAQALAGRNIQVVVVCARCPDTIARHLAAAGIEHRHIACIPGDPMDTRLTLELANSIRSRWIVLDGYHFDYTYQKAIHSAGHKVAVMDDFGHTHRWCADLVVNQNLGSEGKTYFNDIQDHNALTGCLFALLRREFSREYDHPKDSRQPDSINLLITMGGVDPDNSTAILLRSLNRIHDKTIILKIVLGGGNPHFNELDELARASPHQVSLVQNVNDMPSFYNWADGVISAAGSTCYEWLRYGRPAAVVQLAENQLPIVNALVENNAALFLGAFHDLDEVDISTRLRTWIADTCFGRTSDAPRPVVDGKGADRVAAAIAGRFRITIATSEKSWLSPFVSAAISREAFSGHEVLHVHDAADAPPGDILFLLSYLSIVPQSILAKHTHTLVVHASNLPRGRGWSPVSWQILEGENRIQFCLLEALDKVDSGSIFLRETLDLRGDELIDEIRRMQAQVSLSLCQRFVAGFPVIAMGAEPQSGQASYYPRRTPDDSRLNVELPLKDQFNLLRIVDNDAYPAFFEYHDHKYILKIEKEKPDPPDDLQS